MTVHSPNAYRPQQQLAALLSALLHNDPAGVAVAMRSGNDGERFRLGLAVAELVALALATDPAVPLPTLLAMYADGVAEAERHVHEVEELIGPPTDLPEPPPDPAEDTEPDGDPWQG